MRWIAEAGIEVDEGFLARETDEAEYQRLLAGAEELPRGLPRLIETGEG